MSNNAKSKLKTLYVKQILEDETDEEHGLTIREIIDRLEAMDIPAERKSIYRDIQTLRDFGIDIQTYQRETLEYAIAKRAFTLSELMLLVDAVESSKFLTKRQSKALITNLKMLASDSQRALLDRRIHVEGRITSKKDGVFDAIDILHEAMRKHVKVSFLYSKRDINGKNTYARDGQPYVVTPVGITYSDGYYYLTVWSDEHDQMREFRIDRIEQLKLTDNPASKNDEITHHTYDGDEYEYFGRFGGDPITATLLVDGDKIEIITDRFGDSAEIYKKNADTAKAVVKIHKSPQFFGWVAGMDGTVRIDAPKRLKQEYKDYLEKLISL